MMSATGVVMLLRFGVQNLRSIRDKQELSLVASSLDDTRANLIDCRPAGARLLPVVLCLWGECLRQEQPRQGTALDAASGSAIAHPG